MIRFLRYAVEHDRKIRAMFLQGDKMLQKTISIKAFDHQTVSFTIGNKKEIITIPLTDLLSCDYARGDRGET